MIDFDTKIKMFVIKIIDLDIEMGVSAIKTITSLVFEVNSNNRHIKIALIEQNIIVLFQAVIVGSEIWYLVYCLVILIFKDEYPLIFYCKYFQLL